MNRGRKNFRGNRRGGRGREYNNRPRCHGSNYRKDKEMQNMFYAQLEKLCESEACITEYISTCEGFSGILKARFSDFHVNEINLDNDIAVITNQQIPEAFKLKKLEEPPKETPIERISQEKWEAILDMLQSTENLTVEIDVTDIDKEQRAELHKKLKEIFRQKITSSTVAENEKKSIQLKKFSKGDYRDRSIQWPKECGEYVHFVMYKESLDTMDAMMKLGDVLRMNSSAFNYAGVKDKRAKTSQWISARKVEPWKLLFKTTNLKNLHVGNITFKDHPLKLGQLWGNRFKIALRNVTAEDELIKTAVESLKENGFINYYGLQRFGNDKEVPTFKIGIKLLQGNFREAVNLILKPKKGENPTNDITQAKTIYEETKNAKTACEKLGKYNSSIESSLLKALAKCASTDYVTALEGIPRNTRLLYIHSYQSLVWNEVASARIKNFGLKPIVGDLVLIEEQTEVGSNGNNENEVTKTDEETANIKDSEEDSTVTADINETEETTEKLQNVKILTEDDLNNYTIFDIVLPLPGHSIIYPENDIKQLYSDILARNGLSLEMPKQKVKTYSLSGNYRKLIEKPQAVEWKCLKYNEAHDLLIRSDFEEMINVKEPEDAIDGKYKSLIIKFNLVSSSYATMALREVLKIDTSSQSQAKLNKYHDTTKTEEVAQSSLLTDKAKFEAFKMDVFGSNEDEAEETPAKRKTSEEDVGVASKKLKVEEEKKEEGIKIQPSLV